MLKFFVPPLIREINDDGAPKEVREHAQQVAEIIKGKLKIGWIFGTNLFCL